MQRAAFLDRDGVINVDYGYVHSADAFEWVPGVLEAAKSLADAGFLLVVVTNQSGIGRGYYTADEFEALTDWMKAAFARAGAPLAGVYFCPHHPEKALPEFQFDCDCRKPKPGMLLRAARDLDIDLADSFMFGDKPGNCTAGRAAGCRERILLGTNGTAVPDISIAPDATHTAKSLAEAVRMPWFREILK